MNRFLGYIKAHKVGVTLSLIMVMAVFFRFWQLDSLPPGLHPDEAANGLDVFRIFDGDIRPLYNTNGPRESLFFFLQAIGVAILGNTILALRLAPALIGTLAVLATYALVKEWFSKRAGLLAAFIMASAPWAVTMSRIGFRASMVPLLIPLTAWLFTKGIKSGKWYWYVLTGISFGAGFYTYLSFRIMPLVAVAVFALALWKYRPQLKTLVKPLLIIAVTGLVVLAPMIAFAFDHPADVIGGRSSVSFTNPELNNGQPVRTLLNTIGQTALMFNVAGDDNYRHNLGGQPMMDAFIGVMFLLGLLLSLRRIFDIRYFTLLAIFGAMLIPEVLTAEGIPHALRAIGVLPVIYILAAIGIVELFERWRTVFPRNPVALSAAIVAIVALLAASTVYNYQRHFVAWANDPKTYDAYSEDVVAVAEYFKSHEFEGQRYIVIDGYSNITVLYLTKGYGDYVRLDGGQVADLNINGSTQLIVAATQMGAAAAPLQQLPVQVVEEVRSPARPDVVLYTVYETRGVEN